MITEQCVLETFLCERPSRCPESFLRNTVLDFFYAIFGEVIKFFLSK